MKRFLQHFAIQRLALTLGMISWLISVTPVMADDNNFMIDVMTVAGAWAKATPPGSETTAAYMTILNNSDSKDELLGASTPIADSVEIRDSEAKNALLKSVPLMHSDAVVLKPGGIHLVLVGLKHQLVPRDKFTMTFFFKNATKVTTQVAVVAPDNKMPLGIGENGWQ